MILNITIDQESYELEVKQELLDELKSFFEDMDKEYDRGVQMGRFWVESPDDEQRCQVAVNKLVNAMYSEDKRSLYIMAAYIVSKFPDVKELIYNSEYEMQEIDIQLHG
ncbi:MAG: hypothetical protein OQL06_01115 [Gammaproteobacteria bacterium]|nr:hypothetical protein [Gammaproteobacteria bacterium]